MEVIQKHYGEINRQSIYSFTLRNIHGVEITAINYGCIITSIVAPDKNGNLENIVLGHERLQDYIHDPNYLGAIVGRVAGRIRGGSFQLDEKTFHLATNDPPNHLHGGLKGLNKVVWDAAIIDNGITFTYVSPSGEEGYPGNLTIEVTYLLNNDNELSIHYEALTDEKTLVTLTNHSYFNLSGNVQRNIVNHTLTLKSNSFLELDEELIPTGRILEVENTPFDFTRGRKIKEGIVSEHPQNILVGEGYDHPFLLNKNHENEIVLKDMESGRTLTIETDEPAVVVYTGNSLGTEGDFRGIPSQKYLGICLETQALPDAIHQTHFPSIIIDKGQTFTSVTTYKFGVVES
jgi:aldose 1-epimerase